MQSTQGVVATEFAPYDIFAGGGHQGGCTIMGICNKLLYFFPN